MRTYPLMPAQLAWLFATRPVFLYPELLPLVSLDPALLAPRTFNFFLPAEDWYVLPCTRIQSDRPVMWTCLQSHVPFTNDLTSTTTYSTILTLIGPFIHPYFLILILFVCVCACSSLLVLGMRNMQGTLKPMENLCQYLLRAKAPAQTRGHLMKQSTPRRPDSILKVGLLLSPCTHRWRLMQAGGDLQQTSGDY